MLKLRKIVIDNKIPRRLELQPNILLNYVDSSCEIVYKDYEESFEGIIQSMIERFPSPFQSDVYKQWVKDATALRRNT